jgi:hypothetical protein
LTILYYTKKYQDNAIPVYILKSTFLKKHICLVKQQDYILLSCNLKDLKELALKLAYISEQVFSKDLEMLKKACLLKYKTCSYTKYISFLQCSAIVFIVIVFLTSRLSLKLQVSPYLKITIRVLYYKRTIMPRPFSLTKSSNSLFKLRLVAVTAIIVSLCLLRRVKQLKGSEDHFIFSMSATANLTVYTKISLIVLHY